MLCCLCCFIVYVVVVKSLRWRWSLLLRCLDVQCTWIIINHFCSFSVSLNGPNVKFCPIESMHFRRMDRPMDRQMDEPTNGQTDKPLYRDARTQLKMVCWRWKGWRLDFVFSKNQVKKCSFILGVSLVVWGLWWGPPWLQVCEIASLDPAEGQDQAGLWVRILGHQFLMLTRYRV